MRLVLFFFGVILLQFMVISEPLHAGLTTRTVFDQLERPVVVPLEPKRVIALAPSITEIVYSLGREDLLVGATQFSDYPPEAKKIPKVGSYVHLDLEKIVSLKPDLCLAVKDGNPRDMVQRIETFGIPVFAVNPDGLDSVMKAVLKIGDILNVSGTADAVVQDMNKRIQNVKNYTNRLDKPPGVFLQIGISPIVSVGEKTFLHELIELAGGKNLSAGTTPYPRFSKEQVLVMNPDVIIITSMARAEIFENVKKEWDSWPGMSAVKNNRVYIVNSDILDRPTPRMVAGLEMLTKVIHPEFVIPVSLNPESKEN